MDPSLHRPAFRWLWIWSLPIVFGVFLVMTRCTSFEGFDPTPTDPTTSRDRVLGQPSGRRYTQRDRGMYKPQGVYVYNGKLYVMDSEYHRVLIWNSIPEAREENSHPPIPDIILANLDARITPPPAANSNTLNIPTGLHVDENRLYVADNNNHRVLIWEPLPTISAKHATRALGQENVNTNTPFCAYAPGNLGTNSPLINAGGMCYTPAVFTILGKLFVSDADNFRVLGWDSVPSSNAPPDFELGTRVAGNSLSAFRVPKAIASDGTQLFLADPNNNRVLIWNTIPSAGDGDFAADAALTGSPALTFNQPMGVSSNGHQLAIADTLNHRVLIYDPIPTSGGTPAPTAILGQSTTSGNISGVSQTKMNRPISVHLDDSHVYVADQDNSRVLIWNSIPTTGLANPADVVLGQASWSSAGAQGIFLDPPSQLRTPYQAFFDGQYIVVADAGNHRVLLWNGFPAGDGQAPDWVLGQASLSGTASTEFNSPQCAFTHNNKVYVCDTMNSKIKIWNLPVTANGEAPDETFDLAVQPHAAFTDGQRLFVSTNTHQVLIWNDIDNLTPTPDVTLGTGSNTPINEFTFSSPRGIYSDGHSLWVADASNNRVLVWKTIPASSNTAADLVLGQSSFSSASIGIFQQPRGISKDGKKLYVSNYSQHRILVWNNLPDLDSFSGVEITTDFDEILGQDDALSTNSNKGSVVTFDSLSLPMGIHLHDGLLFIADSFNERIVIRDLRN